MRSVSLGRVRVDTDSNKHRPAVQEEVAGELHRSSKAKPVRRSPKCTQVSSSLVKSRQVFATTKSRHSEKQPSNVFTLIISCS